MIVQKAAAALSEKTGRRIEIGSVSIAFTHSIVLERIFIAEGTNDTLLFIGTLAADVNLFGLFSNEIIIRKLRIDSLVTRISRSVHSTSSGVPDSSYNFSDIITSLNPEASETDKLPDSTASQSPWTVAIHDIHLSGIDGSFDDEVSGMNARLRLGSLEASLDTSDIERMRFHFTGVSLKNTNASVILTKESAPDTSASQDIGIGFNDLSVSNIQFLFQNTASGDQYYADIGAAAIAAELVDLPSRRIALNSILLENSSIALVSSSAKQQKAVQLKADTLPWQFTLDRLGFTNISVQYDVLHSPRVHEFDMNHLRVDELTVRADDINYSKDRITMVVGRTSFRERSGFDLREFSGSVEVDSVHTKITDLTLKTPSSRLHMNLLLAYEQFSALLDSPGTASIRMTVDESYLSASDLLLFQPSLPLKKHYHPAEGTIFTLAADLRGHVNALEITELNVQAGESSVLDLSGTVTGLPDMDSAQWNITLHQLSMTAPDLRTVVDDSLIPRSIEIPAALVVTGRFNGTMENFSASAALRSSIGSMKAHLDAAGMRSSATARWKTSLNIAEFDLGVLLKDTLMFGPFSLDASAAGTGMTADDLSARVNVFVIRAVVNGYPYKHLTVAGNASATTFEGKAEMKDSNIVFIAEGLIDIDTLHPAARFTVDLQGIDLYRLNITDEDIRVSGFIFSDISGSGMNDLNGTAGIRSVVIVKNDQRYIIDTLMVASVAVDEGTHIALESSIFRANFDGTVTPGDLPGVMKSHFSKYFGSASQPHQKDQPPQAFAFELALRDPSVLSAIFFPDLHELSGGMVSGSFDSKAQRLNISASLPAMRYSDIDIDSLSISVVSDADSMNAEFKVHSISDSMFLVTNLLITGKASQESVNVSIQSSRDDGFLTLLLAGVLSSDPEGYSFRLKRDGVMFRNIPWSVPTENVLRFGKRSKAGRIRINGTDRTLSIQSETGTDEPPSMKFEFRNFDLALLSQAVERQEGLFGGILQGDAVLHTAGKQTSFTADLAVTDVRFRTVVLGNAMLQADNHTAGSTKIKFELNGNSNRIALNGQLRSTAGGTDLDLKLDMTKVNLAAFEPFMAGHVTRLSGTLSGGFSITGSTQHPSVIGEVNFSNTAFNPSALESYLRLDRGTVVISKRGIEFRTFELTDSRGKKASLSGRVLTDDYRTYQYDVRLRTNDFLVLNTPASRDALVYGTVILDSDISITGDQKQQTVIIRAELDKGTNLSLILPESETAAEERRGIVRFTKAKVTGNPIMTRTAGGTNVDTVETVRSTIALTSNITVNKDSKLRILIDPVAGDSLVIRGEATLSFTVDPSGKITLTGRYEIVEGSYLLSFGDFIKREFAIVQGSSLTWLGSPFNADADITAVYTVKTNVLDLIQDQLGGLSAQERNKYQQEIPVQVHLMMKGKLLTPEIRFKLDLPPESRGVLNGSIYAKLNELNGQESELNKQVFALLVLGRFISETPFASAGDNDGLSDFARSSASQILSAQLNRLSEQYIKGVQLNMGVESYKDYSTGSAEGRTQLQLALSKQLFNDRVTVQAGGNVDLEGERSQKNSLNNFAGDLKVLYKLTDDGRWKLQVFRKNTYEGAIDGDITKTGAGVVFTLDFNKLFGLTLTPVPK